MASYGATNGGPAWTGFSPTLGSVPGAVGNNGGGTSPVVPNTTGVAAFNGMTQDDARIAHFFRNKANAAVRQLIISMIGAAPGALAQKSAKRVQAQSATDIIVAGQPRGLNIGGLVPIETFFYINRNNTVNDDNDLSALFNRLAGPPVPGGYAVDTSLAGGGGKAGVAAGNIRATGYF